MFIEIMTAFACCFIEYMLALIASRKEGDMEAKDDEESRSGEDDDGDDH